MHRSLGQRLGLAQGAQAIDGSRQRELGAAQAIDDVAAPDPALLLHRAEDRVDRAEAAVDAFRVDGFAHQDAVPLEERERGGVPPLGLRGKTRGGPRRARRRLRAIAAPAGIDQRPAPGSLGRAEAREPARSRAPVTRRPLPAQCAQRGEGVVGDLAGPHEVPQRIEHFPIRPAAGGGEQLPVEARPASAEVLPEALVTFRVGSVGAVGEAHRPKGLATRPDEHDPPVVASQAPAPDPRDLAHRAQLVEEPRLIPRDPGRQDVALEDAGGDGQARELVDDLREALQRGGSAEGGWRRFVDRGDAVPRRQEPGEGDRVDRLDLAPQLRQGPPAKEAKDVRIAPFAFRAAGPELAAEQRPAADQAIEGVLDDARWQPPATRRFGAQERSMRPRPARKQPVERVHRGSEERLRDADRRRDPDAVAIARHVLHGDPAVHAGDPDLHHASRRLQLPEPGLGGGRTALGPRRELVGREVAEPAQQVVDLVERGRPTVVSERLEAQLEVGEGIRVEELAQLLLAQQLAQQVAIERERLCPSLGEWRIAVVHVGGDVVEQQRAREGRGRRGLDRVDGDLAALDAGQDVAQRGQVEGVREDLAVRLDQDREAAIAAGHGEQVRGPLPLLPQRRAGAGSPARQQQRTGRVLPEA